MSFDGEAMRCRRDALHVLRARFRLLFRSEMLSRRMRLRLRRTLLDSQDYYRKRHEPHDDDDDDDGGTHDDNDDDYYYYHGDDDHASLGRWLEPF